MLNFKFIGLGAAGNKAVVNLVENRIIRDKDALLVNSTLKDIPKDITLRAIQIGNMLRGGCGKERKLGKELAIESIQNNKLEILDTILDPNDTGIVLISSTEGGTGSGSVAVIAEYCKEVLGTQVHIISFTGFEEDARGLANTVDYFNDLSSNYTIEIISNKKFLDEAKGNKIKAEKLANDELGIRVKVLLGNIINESEQNIDETDLFKVVTTSGYMVIETGDLSKIKNTKQFNEIVQQMLDNTKSIELSEASCKRLAVILNISEKTKDFIDYSFDEIKNRLGIPYEVFTHIQTTEDKEYISIIASGMRMPIEEIKEIHDKYLELSSKVNIETDTFFSNKSMRIEDNTFDSAKSSTFSNDVDDRKKKFLQKNNTEKIVNPVKKDDQSFLNNY